MSVFDYVCGPNQFKRKLEDTKGVIISYISKNNGQKKRKKKENNFIFTKQKNPMLYRYIQIVNLVHKMRFCKIIHQEYTQSKDRKAK